jgi:hypothetical protein
MTSFFEQEIINISHELPIKFLGHTLTPANTATRGYTLGDLPIEFFIEGNAFGAIVTRKEKMYYTATFVGYYQDEISLLACLMRHCDVLDKYFYKYMLLI